MKSVDYLICFVIIGLILIASDITYHKGYDDLKQEYNSLIQSQDGRRRQMCDITFNVNGIAWKNKTAVWVENRAEKYINRTDYHESCHLLINNKKEHFCRK